jgi:predicted MFS family arabinose efflux permease
MVFFKEDLGYSGMQIGILCAIQAVTGAVAAFPAGFVNDRITSRTLVAISLVGQGAGYLGLTFVQSFVPFALVYFFFTLANSLFRISLDVQVLKSPDGLAHGHRVGIYQAGRFAGLALGTAPAGYLLSGIGFANAFLLVAGTSVLLSAGAIWLQPTPIGRVRLSEYRADFSNPAVLFFCGWLFLFAGHWGAEFTSYPLFLREGLGLTLPQAGWYMGVEFVIAVVVMLTLRNRTDTDRQIRAILLCGLLASGVGHVGMVVPTVSVSFLFRLLHAGGDAAVNLVFFTGIARLFSVERLGGNAGLINMVAGAGMVLGALVYGPVGELAGYDVPLWTSGLITCALVPAIWWRK